jgi:hypothetical protein
VILFNRTLIGEVRFGKRQYKHHKGGKRQFKYVDESQHKVYTDEALRILPTETFQRIHAKIASRAAARGPRQKNVRTIRPFTGLIFCQDCGCVFYAQKSHGGKYYYRCSNRDKNGRAACPHSCSVREDQLLGEVKTAYAGIFDDADSFITEMVREAERTIGTQRNDAARLKSEIATQDKLIAGLNGLLLDPDMADMAKLAVKRQLAQVGAKVVELQASLDGVADRAHTTSEAVLRSARLLFEKARERFEAVGTASELHAFIERFVGPSVALPDGRLLPRFIEAENSGTTGEIAGGAIGMIAAAHHDTDGEAFRAVFWQRFKRAA